MSNLTRKQKELLQEILAKFNERRRAKGRPATTLAKIPQPPGYVGRYYLVDNYQVKRHWRRRPVRR